MKNRIKTIIKEAYQSIVGDEHAAELTDQTSLMPSSEALDSRDFVMLVVCVERAVSDQLGCRVSLISDKAFSEKRSPFRSVEAFATFVDECVTQQQHLAQ